MDNKKCQASVDTGKTGIRGWRGSKPCDRPAKWKCTFKDFNNEIKEVFLCGIHFKSFKVRTRGIVSMDSIDDKQQ